MLDLAEHHNETITKSAGNLLTSLLLTSLLPTSLLPASLPPTFKPLVSLSPAASKIFNRCYASTSLKRQADRITIQNV